jgi:non-ribosomal peptide synthase protein (TIGR01720 family)
LLTALLQTFIAWTGAYTFQLDIEGHGREELTENTDLSRTVGWLTTVFPVILRADDRMTIDSMLKSVKEQIRAIPHHGIGYGVLRYLAAENDGRFLQDNIAPEVSFNYLGRLDEITSEDQGLTLSLEYVGTTRSLRNRRCYVLEITAGVVENQLRVDWVYSENLHAAETMERLSTTFLHSLQEIILHCLTPNVGGYTPSDFPQANITQTELDKIVNRLNIPNIRPTEE